ncbi:MAG TPA: Stk1 family PASTA domain-containing Ser/Thr kinase [Frankiaceae bacterium]|nr:Stk1 family PASTA domain-containing Ser/Thr kinase [Frankiaceae bacterium]
MTERATLLGGRYEVGEPLGQGGMAEVLRGRDTRLGRDVAVKILRPELASDPTFIARFRREAQAAASLNHPNIVSVFDTGDDTGTPFIVMEYVEGRTLRDILRTQGRMMPQRALEIVADVCAAVEHAHQQGLVHRDIKPANVMINSAGTVKVMDFGIARALSASSSTMTQTAAVVGTAQYLSPEQARGEHVDARSDVYSTGCLLYELLTHQPPFTGDSAVAVAYQHVLEDPDLPSTLNPDIEPAVEAVVMKSMAKNPGNRYQSAAEMRDDLLRAAAGRAVRATPILSAADTTLLTPAAASTTVLTTTPPVDRRNRRAAAYALLALATIAVFIGSLLLVRSLFNDGGGALRVPDVRGEQVNRAQQVITEAGFTVGEVTQEFHPTAAVGIVVNQDPLSGFSARRGDAINLTVSRGIERIPVPDVTGQQLEDARRDLESLGFKVKVTEKEQVGAPGRVLAVNPPPRTVLAKGATVTLTVISGQLTVPDVFGMTYEQARAKLEQAGFNNVAREDVQTDNPAEVGTVVEQDPKAGAKADRDAQITLRVAQPAPTTPPATTPPPPDPSPSSEPPFPTLTTSTSAAPPRED